MKKHGCHITMYYVELISCIFQILEDWRYIAMVIDRLQLCIFMAVTIGGTVGILINAALCL